MSVNQKNAVIIALTALLCGAMIVSGLALTGQVGTIDNQSLASASTETPEPVDESNVSGEALAHKQAAVTLAEELDASYTYSFDVSISKNGNNTVTTVAYSSQRDDPDELKYEMKDMAVTYAEVAADEPHVGSLVLKSDTITLTVPQDVAEVRGNENMTNEEYFKHVRWDSEEDGNS